MTIVRSKDDALTILIHLGYLSYNWRDDECYIREYSNGLLLVGINYDCHTKQYECRIEG